MRPSESAIATASPRVTSTSRVDSDMRGCSPRRVQAGGIGRAIQGNPAAAARADSRQSRRTGFVLFADAVAFDRH
jgi:hypothetical protein